MRGWSAASVALVVLCCSAAGWAQHVAPDPGRHEAMPSNSNSIRIEGVAPGPAVPITPVVAEPLADLSPDLQTEAFLDGVFATQIAAGRIVGAAVVVVRDGRVVVQKGYGFSNRESKRLVDPDTTLFRVASISKLFTALLAMQQVEEGRIDLDADVNAYLKDFKLPAFGPQPVTLAHLLSHTGGFDDRFIGVAAPLGVKAETLTEHLKRRMPPRVMPAGEVLSYSNYGFAVAGHMVEQTAGRDFGAVVKERIFDKLGMTRSTFGVPSPVPAEMATPYVRRPNGHKEGRLDQLLPHPAGDLVTSAGDMARFMVAIADGGGGLVKPETLDKMLRPVMDIGPGGDSWGLGFAIGDMKGRKWVGHGGAWPGFAAELRLDPAARSGFFIALNVDNSFEVVQPIVAAISARLLPSERPARSFDKARAVEAAKALAGTYVPNRRVRGDVTAIAAGASALQIVAQKDGSLAVTNSQNPVTLTFRPIAEDLWQEPNVKWRLSAYRTATVISDGLVLGPFPYERASFKMNLGAHSALLAAASAIFGLTLAGWMSGFMTRRMFGEPQSRVHTVGRLAGVAAAALGLAFVVGVAVSFSSADEQSILSGDLSALTPVLLLPVPMAVATLVCAAIAILGFGPGLRARLAQAGFVILTLSAIFVLWFAWNWKLHILAL